MKPLTYCGISVTEIGEILYDPHSLAPYHLQFRSKLPGWEFLKKDGRYFMADWALENLKLDRELGEAGEKILSLMLIGGLEIIEHLGTLALNKDWVALVNLEGKDWVVIHYGASLTKPTKIDHPASETESELRDWLERSYQDDDNCPEFLREYANDYFAPDDEEGYCDF